jgi:hypothetical protein
MMIEIVRHDDVARRMPANQAEQHIEQPIERRVAKDRAMHVVMIDDARCKAQPCGQRNPQRSEQTRGTPTVRQGQRYSTQSDDAKAAPVRAISENAARHAITLAG